MRADGVAGVYMILFGVLFLPRRVRVLCSRSTGWGGGRGRRGGDRFGAYESMFIRFFVSLQKPAEPRTPKRGAETQAAEDFSLDGLVWLFALFRLGFF